MGLGAAANCSKRDGQGILEQKTTIQLEQLPIGHYHAETDDHLSSHLKCHLVFIFLSCSFHVVVIIPLGRFLSKCMY